MEIPPEQWRLVVKLKSRAALLQFMQFRGLSVRTLAKEAGVGHAIVGHLASGHRKTCSIKTARGVEEALQCPPGFLFDPTMSSVARDTRQAAA